MTVDRRVTRSVARGLVTVAVMALAGCNGSTPPKTNTPPPRASGTQPAPTPPAPAPEADANGSSDAPAAAAARAVLMKQLEALGKLDAAGFSAPFAENGFLLGPAAEDIVKGKTAIQEFAAKYTARVASGPLLATALRRRSGSEGEGAVVWALDDVVLSTSAGQKANAALYRVASLLEKNGDAWVLHAQAWTVSLPDDQMRTLAESTDIGKPAPMAHDVESDAEIAVNWMRRYIDSDDKPLEGRKDSLFAGSGPDSVAVGDKAVNDVVASMRARKKSGQANFTRTGGVFGRTAGPKAIYVVYNLADQRTPLTFRSFEVFVREGNFVRPVLSLLSVAMPPRAPAAPN